MMSGKAVEPRQVPPGSVVMSEKFQGSELHTILKGSVKVHIEGDVGCADFFPNPRVACVFLPEAEVINPSTAIKAKLAVLAKSSCRGVVLAECTALSEQYFGALQEVATLQLRLVAIPVTSQSNAAKYIAQLVKVCSRPDNSQASHSTPVDNAVLQAVRLLPKTGSVKANTLIGHFGSIESMSAASLEELSEVVGRLSAESIHGYFHQPLAGQERTILMR